MSDDLYDSRNSHDSIAPRDEALERVVRELRHLPPIDPAAKARVLVAVAAERARGDGATRPRSPRVRIAALLALAAGLMAVVVLLRRGMDDRRAASVNVAAHPAPAPQTTTGGIAGTKADAKLASSNTSPSAETMMVPVQLVVRAPAARRMSVVGDFTGWDQGRVAMTRDAASGLWSATVSVRPGRHVYAFVADDSVWMRDPRAPVATDADFGRPGSLLLVGRP